MLIQDIDFCFFCLRSTIWNIFKLTCLLININFFPTILREHFKYWSNAFFKKISQNSNSNKTVKRKGDLFFFFFFYHQINFLKLKGYLIRWMHNLAAIIGIIINWLFLFTPAAYAVRDHHCDANRWRVLMLPLILFFILFFHAANDFGLTRVCSILASG
jgi:hypothetical protein